MTCTEPAIGLVIAKVPYFPPIPVAKVHRNNNIHSDTIKNLEQKYGKQNITVIAINKKYDVPNVLQQQYSYVKDIIGRIISNTKFNDLLNGGRFNDCIIEISRVAYIFTGCIFTNCRFYVHCYDKTATFDDISCLFKDCKFEGSSTFTTRVNEQYGDPQFDRPMF